LRKPVVRELALDEVTLVAGGYAAGRNTTVSRVIAVVADAAFRTAAMAARG